MTSVATMPLSGSIGGAPIRLDEAGVPGKLIHACPMGAGGNDIVRDVLVGNPNTNAIPIYVATTGPGITPPATHADMIKIEVPPGPTGTVVRAFYAPFLLEPGFSYYISCPLQPGAQPPYFYGYIHRSATTAFAGVGGLTTRTPQVLPTIAAGEWTTVPYTAGAVANPINFAQDYENNQFSLEAEGTWYLSNYGVFEARKDSGDRIIYMRLWNATKNENITPDPWPMWVEGNKNGGLWSYSLPIELLAANVKDSIRVEIGGADKEFRDLKIHKAGISAVRIIATGSE